MMSDDAGNTVRPIADAGAYISPGSPTWPVHESYEIHHGAVLPLGDEVRRYDLTTHPEVVGELSKLHEGNERQVLKFARTWGLLGCGRPVSVPVPAYDDGSEEFIEGAEPLHWLWSHAGNTRMVLQLGHYLQEDDQQGLGLFLRNHCIPSGSGGTDRVQIPVGSPWIVMQMTFPWGHPTELAASMIGAIINCNLEGCRHQMATGPLRLQLHVSTLLAAVYWHLATVVTGSRRLAFCEDCGALFVQADRRQRFCPPPPEWTGKTGSLCGARFRKRRLRQKKGG